MNQPPSFQCSIDPDFNFLSDDYKELFAKSRASAFQQPDWMQKLQAYAQSTGQGETITLLIRERESQQLLLVLPLLLRKKGPLRLLEFLNMGFVDYANVIYDPASLPHMLDQGSYLSQQIKNSLPTHDLIWIKHLQQNDPALDLLFPENEMLVAGFGSHRTDLDGEFDHWRKRVFGKKRRGNLRRARQKLQDLGDLRSSLLVDAKEIEQAFEALRAFRHARFSSKRHAERLQEQAAFDFYLQLAIEGVHDGSTRTYQLSLGESCIAVAFGLCYQSEFIYLLPGADFHAYARYSPGAILLEDMIRDLMAEDIRVFDFSIGDEGYKKQFGTYPIAMQTMALPNSVLGSVALVGIRQLKDYQQRQTQKAAKGEQSQTKGFVPSILKSLLGPEKG